MLAERSRKVSEMSERIQGVPVPKPDSTKAKVRRGKYRSYAMERRLEQDFRAAGDPGARRSLASGAYKGIGQDGDVQASEFLVEAKNYTPIMLRGSETVPLRLRWLYGKEGVIEQAKTMGKPGLVVMQPKNREYKVVIMDYDQFLSLFTRWNRGD
jgi:hypothetical protein